VWALIPWLDRKSRRGLPTRGFTDYGNAAILFLSYLTLKAWDIGGGGTADTLPDPAAAARVCGLIVFGLAAVQIAIRVGVYGHRRFTTTIAVLLQVALHGFLGMGYLLAGLISVVVALAMYFMLYRGRDDALEGARS